MKRISNCLLWFFLSIIMVLIMAGSGCRTTDKTDDAVSRDVSTDVVDTTDDIVSDATDDAPADLTDDTVSDLTDDVVFDATDDTMSDLTDDDVLDATDDTVSDITDNVVMDETDDSYIDTTDLVIEVIEEVTVDIVVDVTSDIEIIDKILSENRDAKQAHETMTVEREPSSWNFMDYFLHQKDETKKPRTDKDGIEASPAKSLIKGNTSAFDERSDMIINEPDETVDTGSTYTTDPATDDELVPMDDDALIDESISHDNDNDDDLIIEEEPDDEIRPEIDEWESDTPIDDNSPDIDETGFYRIGDDNDMIVLYDDEPYIEKQTPPVIANNESDVIIERKTEDTAEAGFNIVDLKDKEVTESELKIIDVDESKKFYISLKYGGWIIKKLDPPILNLLSRENKDTNTLFEFNSISGGRVNIVFMRYDKEEDSIFRMPYLINIRPKVWVDVGEEEVVDDEEPLVFEEGVVEEESVLPEKKEETDDYDRKIADQHYRFDNLIEAGKIYRKIIDSGNADSQVLYRMGIIETRAGNDDAAHAFFNEAIKDTEGIYYTDSLLELIKNLKKREKYDEALGIFFEQSVDKEFEIDKAMQLAMLLGDIYYNKHDFTNAAVEYRRFMVKFSDSPDVDKAIFYLAYCLEHLEVNPRYEDAHRLYTMIIDEYPESGYYDLSNTRLLHLERHYLMIN